MKLRQIFKTIGLSLFLVALLLFLYVTQNPKADVLSVSILAVFGLILATSGACLITGEMIARIETLENKVFFLEEEIRKLKSKGNENE